MGQVLHASATTTEAIRRAIQNSKESLRALSKRYGINQKTVAKWRKRTSVADRQSRGPWRGWLISKAQPLRKLSSSFRLQGQIFTSLDRRVPSAGGSAVRYSQLLLPLGLGEAI